MASSSSSSSEDCEAALLQYLQTDGAIVEDTYPWSIARGLPHDKVVGAIKSLLVDAYLHVEDLSNQFWSLEVEGTQIVANGSPERLVFEAVSQAGRLSLTGVPDVVGKDVAKIGMSNCLKNKWVKKDGGDLIPAVESVEDDVQQSLVQLQQANFALTALDDKVTTTHTRTCAGARSILRN